MAIYNEIIKTLGENLVEYNVGAWALFRDQMATEISSQYIFGNGRKPDESLLAYSVPYAQKSNDLAKGRAVLRDSVPRAEFTYYTSEGPKFELNSGPTLPEPENESLHITHDFKVGLDDGNETTNMLTAYGERFTSVYDEDNKIPNDIDLFHYGLDDNLYNKHITNYENGETLLSKTQRWFQGKTGDYIAKRFTTTISRFCTKEKIPISELEGSVATQAYSLEYGLSHGRNLRKKEVTNENGYDDPYCRVWTWHKQYHRFAGDTMRPFQDKTGPVSLETLGNEYNWNWFRSKSDGFFLNGGERLEKHGVMYDNDGNTIGLVNITPSMDKASQTYEDPRNVSVEHCMFSIENLAWKGTYGDWSDITEENGLSREQKGPLGGRIMWFPPYDIKFNELTQANWQSNEFIGRGEPIYTYANTTRSGTLSFKLLIDHPAILDYWERRSEVESIKGSGTDDLDSKEQEMLRFFAGCDILKAKSLPPEPEPESEPEDETEPSGEDTEYDNVVQFFVFFPNNYSGKYDSTKSEVEPMMYLINGVATNKYRANNDSSDYGKNPVNLPTDLKKIVLYDDPSKQVGGYEMRSGIGISIVKNATTDNHIADVKYDGSDDKIELVKMIGDKAKKSPTGTTREWNKRRYYYRVDESQDVLNQIFEGEGDNGAVSYIDKDSYQLNSIGYTDVFDYFQIENQFGTYSFADVFFALEGDNIPSSGNSFSDLYDIANITILKNIFDGKCGKIKKVICKGRASSQGNNESKATNDKRNSTLAKERARSVMKWLKSNPKFKDPSIEFVESEFAVDTNKQSNQKDSNDKYAKMNRFAFVEIVYGGSETEDSSNTQLAPDAEGNADSSVITNESNNGVVEGDSEPKEENSIARNGSSVRYDNEALFFQKLTENAPFMARLLSERINNFDPVFHSMSPEGFNARLTFLNQCMRQGPTISSTDTNAFNANNLSFGRPPVCVLRVGDFYNTKIVITSMSINYDPLVWDLNQEGIGVMPMIADISLNFNFIGGSDLGGPIQRLQNATSFNYYANASVYDNRAEEIEYKYGDYIGFKAYQPK